MVNVLYNEFVDDFEKESELEYLKESVKLDRVLLAINTITEKANLDIMDAEIKCLEESGDLDSLVSYYSEATEEANEKKDGLIKKAWEAIKKLCRNIKEFIFGSKASKVLEEKAKKGEEIGVDEDGNKFIQALKSLKGTIGNTADSIKNKFKDMSTVKKVLSIIEIGVVGAAIPLTAVGVHKYKAGEINGLKDYVNDIIGSIEGAGDTLLGLFKEGPISSAFNKVISFLRSAVSKLFSFVGGAVDTVKEVITGDKKDEKDEKMSEEDIEKLKKEKREAKKERHKSHSYHKNHGMPFGTKKISELGSLKRKKFDAEMAEWNKKRKANKEAGKGQNARHFQETNKKLQEEKEAIYKKYNVMESAEDDDIFGFELPESMMQESVHEDAIDIYGLLDLL